MNQVRHCDKRLFDSSQSIAEVTRGDISIKCPKCKQVIEYQFLAPRYRVQDRIRQVRCSKCNRRLFDTRLRYTTLESHKYADVAIRCECKEINRVTFSGIVNVNQA